MAVGNLSDQITLFVDKTALLRMKIISALAFVLAIVLMTVPAFSQQQYPVRFAWGTEYFPENFTPGFQLVPGPEEVVNGYYVRYIQCHKLPDATERAVLENAGVKFLGYVPFGAYLVALPHDLDLQLLDRLAVRSVVPVKPAWKMARNLLQPPYGAWAVHGDQIDLNLQVYGHLTIREGADLCRKNGLTVLMEGRYNGFLKVRLPRQKLEEVASLPFLRFLELVPEPGQPDDPFSRSLHRSNQLDSDSPLGLKFNGEGVNVLIRDDAIIGPHIDFQGRLTNLLAANHPNTPHGDGVAGVLAGAGNLDPTNKGMAAGADIFAIYYTCRIPGYHPGAASEPKYHHHQYLLFQRLQCRLYPGFPNRGPATLRPPCADARVLRGQCRHVRLRLRRGAGLGQYYRGAQNG